MKCPGCGEENPGNAIFCMICGARFASRGGQPEAPQAPEATRPLRQVPEPTPPFHPERGKDQATVASSYLPTPPNAVVPQPPPMFASPPLATPAGTSPAAAANPVSPAVPGSVAGSPPPSSPPPPQPREEPLPSPQQTIPLHPLPGFLLDAKEDLPSSPRGLAGTQDLAGPAPGSYPSPSDRPTTPMAPVTMPPTSTTRVSEKVVCPQCYAQNPRGNLHCQECGSPLPSILTGATRTMAPQAQAPSSPMPAVVPPPVSMAPAPAPQITVVMPAQTAARAPYGGKAGNASGGKSRMTSFGPADGLAIFAMLSIAAAISPLFKWMEGNNLSAFGFQGVNSPGGPALLPYAGMEWLTVGVVAALALGLTLIFILVRVGRGPMFMLAGWLSLAPFTYLAFQGLLPQKIQGMELKGALGFKVIFFGGGPAQQPALTPAIWLLTGAGVLLLLAGFLAPPRGWGRLMTFFLFGLLTSGLVFFCAVAYCWNLFIPKAIEGLLPVLPRILA